MKKKISPWRKAENVPVKKKVPVNISKKPYENAREKNILPVKILWNSTRETEIDDSVSD